jgi:hypothetical protein
MSRLESKAELARLAGVSKQAVTKACRKKLAAACRADRIDLDHPAVRKFISGGSRQRAVSDRARTAATERRDPAPAVPTPQPKPVKKSPARPTASRLKEGEIGSTADLDAYAALLKPLTDRFGTVRNFRDWLLALKDIEVVRQKRLSNEETEGRLISRDLVKTHVLGTFEAAFRRLLNDVPKTGARRIYSAAKAGDAVEEGERILLEVMSSHLSPLKTAAARLLREE